MKRLVLSLMIISALSLSGCGLFKEQCHCPKFGYQQATPQHFAQQAAVENPARQ